MKEADGAAAGAEVVLEDPAHLYVAGEDQGGFAALSQGGHEVVQGCQLARAAGVVAADVPGLEAGRRIDAAAVTDRGRGS